MQQLPSDIFQQATSAINKEQILQWVTSKLFATQTASATRKQANFVLSN